MSQEEEADTLLLDARGRAQLRRLYSWEVRGTYERLRRARHVSATVRSSETVLMSLAPLAPKARESVRAGLARVVIPASLTSKGKTSFTGKPLR